MFDMNIGGSESSEMEHSHQFLSSAKLLQGGPPKEKRHVGKGFPRRPEGTRDFKPDIINIAVDKVGDVYIEKTNVNLVALHSYLSNKFRENTNVPVYISGDKDATHGAVIRVLDAVRREGIQKVSFAISAQPQK